METYSTRLWYYAEYKSFRIESEAGFYKLHVAGFNGDAGDSLSNISEPLSMQTGMNFSTYDVDNDMTDNIPTCAVRYNSGFWFNRCGSSCLTGMNGTKYFSWGSLHEYGLQNLGKLRAARMMIRSI